MILLEAKGVTGFTNLQLQSKIRRFKDIFSDEGNRYPGVIPHFVLISPKKPVNIQTDKWPSWLLPDGEISWIEMALPKGLKRITRCDERGHVNAEGQWWKIIHRK